MKRAILGLVAALATSMFSHLFADTARFATEAGDPLGTAAEKARSALILGVVPAQDQAAGLAATKQVADGLYMSGRWNASWSAGTVNLTLDQINNDSTTRTTGTLRLELWASTSAPARGQGFNGYRLAVFSTFNPLPPRNFYSNITRSAAFSEPPAGTYWLVLVLSEFDSANCPASDRFCIEDSINADTRTTFGSTPPPSTTLTIISQAGSQCYQNYPASAYELLQQSNPGLFQSHPPSTTCSSLGMPFFAGYLAGSGGAVSVWTPNSSVAQTLCLSGAIVGCTTSSAPSNYSDLWWNPNESGWGVAILHHTSGVAFVAWYTYDSAGNPKWYVASNCRMTGSSCSGTLYETSGPPFGPTFDPSRVSVREVGSISLSFSSANNGTMTYNVRGSTGTKSISRQPF